MARGRGWKGGAEPPDRAHTDVPAADPVSVARNILFRQLERAPKTRCQLALALRSRDVPEEIAEPLLDRFEELGLINDRVYAQMWVDSRRSGRPLSRWAMRRELVNKGVDPEVVDEVLADLSSDDERGDALDFAVRRANGMSRLAPDVAARRLTGALARRGYSHAVISGVVRQALEALDEEEPSC